MMTTATALRIKRVLLLALLIVAVASAAVIALASEPSPPKIAANTTTPTPVAVSTSGVSSELSGTPESTLSRDLLPPGAFDGDPGPSPVIFPPQSLTVRFNHKLHVKQFGATCKTCHADAATSKSSQDKLTPKGTRCDTCHLTDHKDVTAVKAGPTPYGECQFCHEGYKPGDGNKVAAFVIPRANLTFDHQAHVSRNIGCQQCHGAVQELGMATRDQLPRMRGCFGCHNHPDAAARGTAKSDCETCHIKGGSSEGSGRMKTMFASGVLKPPAWLHNAQHAPDWLARHKYVATNDSQFCATCHKEEFCTGCHDGRVRPRTIHPNDYLQMHPIEARLATQKCTSCHREQSFCLGCHQRVGVSMSGAAEGRENGRFHPPKEVWSLPPRKPGHHAFEAQRNINACVSCHVERDCIACHGAQGVGAGFSPHRPGFASGCAISYRKNPRACIACHTPNDGALARCN